MAFGPIDQTAVAIGVGELGHGSRDVLLRLEPGRAQAVGRKPIRPRVGILALHAQGRFPVGLLVKNYPFDEVNKAIADSLSGETIKPVLTFGE